MKSYEDYLNEFTATGQLFEFKEIFAELLQELNYNRVKMDEKAEFTRSKWAFWIHF